MAFGFSYRQIGVQTSCFSTFQDTLFPCIDDGPYNCGFTVIEVRWRL